MAGNCLIAQSGGPTAVINNSVYGIVHTFQKMNKNAIIYAGVHGVEGILEEKLFPLNELSDTSLFKLTGLPGAGLGSCRYKLSDTMDGAGDYEKLLKIFQKYDIRYFFYIGGNDSMDSAYKVHQMAKEAQYDMQVIGIPKTVDNDLVHTDHCPGFGSAAKFVANTSLEIYYDIASYPKKQVAVIEAMGRDAGWITGAAGLVKHYLPQMQQLVYLPEIVFDPHRFVTDIEKALLESPYVMVVASEGLKDKEGSYLSVSDRVDKFGHKQLGGLAGALDTIIKDSIEVDVRAITLNALQRSAMHCVSGNDKKAALEVGQEGAKMALDGKSGVMAAIIRESNTPFSFSVKDIDLQTVRNEVKPVPREWIGDDLCSVTPEFIEYAAPLIMGKTDPFNENGLINTVDVNMYRYK